GFMRNSLAHFCVVVRTNIAAKQLQRGVAPVTVAAQLRFMPPAFPKFPRLLTCLVTACLLSLSRAADERPLAFEGAEGFGAYARGGAGGRTLFVTTRDDTGREGSLRWALMQKGPRIVLFKVGGVFELDSNLKVKEPFLTLDGSTAPDGGVTLKD